MPDYFWTEHAKYKMKQYGLSEQKVKSVIRKPYRVEEGIVKSTIAVMIPAGNASRIQTGRPNHSQIEKPTWKQEIWVMYQIQRIKKGKKIISAWRYPGVSPKNNPIPEDILREISKMN